MAERKQPWLLASVRLPASLADLEQSPLFAAASAGPFEAADLARWLQGARQQPLAAMEWGLVLAAVKAWQQQGWRQAGLRAGQLVSVLAWAAEAAQQQLRQGAGRPPAGFGGTAQGAEDVGNPRSLQALQSTCHGLGPSLQSSCCLLCSSPARCHSSLKGLCRGGWRHASSQCLRGG